MSSCTLSEFADKINELMPAIMRELLKRHVGGFYKVKITMPQFFVLSVLNKQGESRMTDMAHFMNITTAGMTGIVDRLVRDGYIARVSDPKDRRIVKVRLTSKGSNLVERMIGERRKTIMDMFGKISQEEREEYIKILTHVKEHLAHEGA